DRLTSDIYVPDSPNEGLGRLENTLISILKVAPIHKKIMKAVKSRLLSKGRLQNLIPIAVDQGVISREEAKLLILAEDKRLDAIQVDDFSQDEYLNYSR
ncbi:acyl-CoA dehydrogenase, partial [Candidatus Marinamargulisbacteria bacterium SCGC AG-439-L15]